MKTKTILSIAIIALLPITVNATGPAHDSGNSPTVATASAPYQTVTPEEHANEHIASTQYVIGAYNDAIAAVNKVDSEKQGKLINPNTGDNISTELFPGNIFEDMAGQFADPSYDVQDLVNELNGYKQSTGNDAFNKLATAGITLVGMKIMAQRLKNDMEDQRVEIYTTWGNDTAAATQQVALMSAQ